MNLQRKVLLLSILTLCLVLYSTGAAKASSTSRYLYDLDPYEIDPKSWALWRKSLTEQEWQEWCHDLNSQRWEWWRESMSPENWHRWKETMGPEDRELWSESEKMHSDILLRESQEEPAQHFKRKVQELKKVQGQIVPKQKSSSQANDNQQSADNQGLPLKDRHSSGSDEVKDQSKNSSKVSE